MKTNRSISTHSFNINNVKQIARHTVNNIYEYSKNRMIYPDVVIKGLLHTSSSEYDNTFTHTKFSSLQSSHFFLSFILN